MICAWCGSEFLPKTAANIYCTRACYAKGKKRAAIAARAAAIQPIPCARCQGLFVPHRHQTYCDDCRPIAYQEKKNERNKRWRARCPKVSHQRKSARPKSESYPIYSGLRFEPYIAALKELNRC